MEIRPDLGIMTANKHKFGPGMAFPGKQMLNISDSFSKGKSLDKLPSKPVIEKSEEKSEVKADVNNAGPKGQFLEAAAASGMVSGPVGGSLQKANTQSLETTLELLKNKDVKFYKEKTWHIPFVTGKYADADAESVAETLVKGDDSVTKLRTKVGNFDMVPLESKEDVSELNAFFGTGTTSGLARSDAAGFLKDAAKGGLSFRVPGQGKVDAYSAYNYLTTGWEKAGVETKTVDLYREGIALLSLTPDKMRDIFEVQKELKTSWAAYNKLEKSGQKFLNEIGKPVNNTSFAERAEIFKKLAPDSYSMSKGLKIYGVIRKGLDTSEDFGTIAGYYVDLKKRLESGNNEALLAFNYVRQNLKGKPILEQTYVDLCKSTDVNDSIRALRLVTTPVAKESFYDRRDAMMDLLNASGSKGVDHYETISANLLPGETIKDAGKEFADIYKEVKDKHYHDTADSQVPNAFIEMRTTYANNAELREIYGNLFRGLGSTYETGRMMKSLETPFRDTTYRERTDVVAGLLKQLDSEKALESFDFIKANTGENEKLNNVGALYNRLLNSFEKNNFDRTKVSRTKSAFKFVREELKEDKAKTDSFVKFLKKTDSAETAKNVFTSIQKPLLNESYAERERAGLAIVEYTKDNNDKFNGIYRAVANHVYAGETVGEVAEQFAAIHEATDNGEYYINESLKAFLDMKESSKNDKQGFKRYISVLKVLKNIDETKKAIKLIKKPVKNETYEEREKIFTDLYARISDKDGAEEDTVKNYEAISKYCGKNETVKESFDRFTLLFNTLHGAKNNEAPRDAFKFVHDEIKKGTFPGKTAKEVTDLLVKALLINDSLSDAKEYIVAKEQPEDDHTIEKDDGFIVIGGVKLPIGRK